MILATLTQDPSSLEYRLEPRAYDEAFAAAARIPGVVWDKRERAYWLYDDQVAVLLPLLREQRLAKLDARSVAAPVEPAIDPIKPLPGMRPYQVEGAAAIKTFLLNSGGALLGDVPGLGKTVQALCVLRSLQIRHALVLCPAEVKSHWLAEVEKWTDSRVPASILKLATEQKELVWEGIGIVSHDSFRSWMRRLTTISCTELVLVDEMHNFGNSRSQRSKALELYLKRCKDPRPYVLGMTGTPFGTRVNQLWSILNLLWPGRFSSYFRFTQRYCNGHYETVPIREGDEKRVWVAEGASNTAELRQRLRFCMVRREEHEVPGQLPDRTRTVITVPLTDRARKAASRIPIGSERDLYWALGNMGEHKIKATISHVRNLRDQGADVLVYTQLRRHARKIAQAFQVPPVTGAIANPDRRKEILDNHNGVGVATMASVTTGINLIKFDTVVYLSLSYSPLVLQQTEARVRRIGQTRHVKVYYMVGERTIDELIKRTVLDRLTNIASVLGSDNATELAEDLSDDEDTLIAGIVAAAQRLADSM